MGLFDSTVSNNRADQPGSVQMPSLSNVPIEQVISMKQQGMSDPIIVQTLQRDGYKTHQIFDAMNQAELIPGSPRKIEDLQQSSASGGPQIFVNPPPQQPAPIQQMPLPEQQFLPPEQIAPQQPMMQQMPPTSYPPLSYQDQSSNSSLSINQVEEIAESIIEEKWQEMAKGVGKIVEWKDRTDIKINDLNSRLVMLQQSFEELHKALMGKLADYDRNMGSVGTDIKAMQKVFQQMLPAFTENVNELSRLTKGIKSKNQ